jgi:HSP20 family protein
MVQFRRDWLTRMDMMQREMDRLLDHLAGSKPPQVKFSPSAWQPAIDVYEMENEIVVAVELAGVKENDWEIVIDRNTFTIRGERKATLPQGCRGAYHRMEIASGPFVRTIALPVAVDAAHSRAGSSDGLLQVILPKASRGGSTKIRIKRR